MGIMIFPMKRITSFCVSHKDYNKTYSSSEAHRNSLSHHSPSKEFGLLDCFSAFRTTYLYRFFSPAPGDAPIRVKKFHTVRLIGSFSIGFLCSEGGAFLRKVHLLRSYRSIWKRPISMRQARQCRRWMGLCCRMSLAELAISTELKKLCAFFRNSRMPTLFANSP